MIRLTSVTILNNRIEGTAILNGIIEFWGKSIGKIDEKDIVFSTERTGSKYVRFWRLEV